MGSPPRYLELVLQSHRIESPVGRCAHALEQAEVSVVLRLALGWWMPTASCKQGLTRSDGSDNRHGWSLLALKA